MNALKAEKFGLPVYAWLLGGLALLAGVWAFTRPSSSSTKAAATPSPAIPSGLQPTLIGPSGPPGPTGVPGPAGPPGASGGVGNNGGNQSGPGSHGRPTIPPNRSFLNYALPGTDVTSNLNAPYYWQSGAPGSAPGPGSMIYTGTVPFIPLPGQEDPTKGATLNPLGAGK